MFLSFFPAIFFVGWLQKHIQSTQAGPMCVCVCIEFICINASYKYVVGSRKKSCINYELNLMLAELKLLVTSVCVKCRCFCLRLNCRIHFLFMIVAVLAAFYFVQALFAPSLSLQTDSTDVNFCALAFHNSHTSPLCISRMSYTYLQHSKVKWKNLHHIFAVVLVFVHRLSQSHPLCCGKIKCYASCIRTC